MWKKIILSAMLLFAVGTAVNLTAEEPNEPKLYDKMIRKLGRGISNAAFGVVEFPVIWYQVNYEEGGFAACTYGILKAVSAVVVREVVGVVEIVSFLSPLPGCTDIPGSPAWGYAPILQPEWVITPAQSKYNFVYPQWNTLP